jgi:hypothetical protein
MSRIRNKKYQGSGTLEPRLKCLCAAAGPGQDPGGEEEGAVHPHHLHGGDGSPPPAVLRSPLI